MDHCVAADCTDRRPYLICYDPLDGSSNIDINVSIGTIFSILPIRTKTLPLRRTRLLQPGDRQLAAGYIMYGPQTQMALTLGRGVVMFTLDPRTNTYILTNDNVQVPEQAKEFAINCSNKRHWEAPVNRYIEELLAGKTAFEARTTTCAGWRLWLLKYTASFAAAESSCTPRTTAIPPNPASFV